MAGPSLLVRIMGDAKDFTKSIGDTQSAASKVSSAVGGTLTSAFRLASTAVTVAGAATVGFGIESFKTAARVGEMNATLRALSQGNDDVYKSMVKTVDSIRGQGIEAGVAQNLVAQFSRNQLSLADATKIATVAQDAAVISGQNSSETLDQLIHGITTQNSLVLRNAGVNVQAGKAMDEYAASLGRSAKDLTEAERAQAVLNAVIEAGGPIAGAYSAAMEEPGKVLRSFPRLFDDIKVTVGEGLVQAFGPLILNLYDVVKAFSAGVKEGGNLRPILDAITDKVKALTAPLIDLAKQAGEWLKKIPPGVVDKIASSISKIGGAVTGAGAALGIMGAKNIPILGQLLGSINPIVGGIAALVLTTEDGRSAFMDLAKAIIPLVSQISGALAPVVSKLLAAITPLIPIVVKLATTILDNLVKAIAPLLPAVADLVGILGEALGSALEALTPLFNVIGDALRDILAAVAPLLPELGKLVGALLDALLPIVVALVPPIVELIKSAIIPLLPPIISLLKPIMDLVQALAPLIKIIADLLAIIVGLIAKAIGPVIKILAELVALIVNSVVKAIALIPDAAKLAFNWIKDHWPLLVAIITGPIGIAVLLVVKHFDTIKAGIDAVIGWFAALPGRVVNALASLGGAILGVLNSVNNIIRNAFNIDLFDVGRRIIESLAKGIESMAGAVVDKITGIAGKIRGALPFSPAKYGPLRQYPPDKAGQTIVRQLADGMASQARYVERAAANIADSAMIDARAVYGGIEGAGVGVGAPGAARGNGPAVVIQEAHFEGEADIDLFMRQVGWALQTGTI